MPKVLLVEDDNNLREIYEARLQAEGYTIVSARDGEEALVVAKAEKPDLIISDVMMPKISGFEMLDILRNTDGLKDVKVIMLTALGQSEDQKRADKLGADRYLVKSQVTLEDIVKAAQELLGEGTTPMPAGATDTATPVAAAPEPVPAPAAPGPTPPPATPSPAPTVEAEAVKPAPPPAAPSPAPTVEAEAVKPAPPEVKMEPSTPPAPSAGDTDDKIMANAVDTLVANTEKDDKTPAAETDAKPVKTQSGLSGKAKPTRDSAAIKHKKTITPIDTGPKKDINDLLAEEEAKEAGVAAPAESPAATETAEKQAEEQSDTAAATTEDEEALVDAKIEDFVAGATSEPSTPEGAPAEVPPAPAAPPAEQKITVQTDSKPKPAAPAGPTPASLTDQKESSDPDPNSIAL
jgi:CheY-like chemotaxis protein